MTEENGRDALRLACAADRLAQPVAATTGIVLSVRHSMTTIPLWNKGIVLSCDP